MSKVVKSNKVAKSSKSAKSAPVIHRYTIIDRPAVFRSLFTPYASNRGIVGFAVDGDTLSITVDPSLPAPQSYNDFAGRLVDRNAVAFAD